MNLFWNFAPELNAGETEKNCNEHTASTYIIYIQHVQVDKHIFYHGFPMFVS